MKIQHDVCARSGISAWFNTKHDRYLDHKTGVLNVTLMSEHCIVDLGLDLMYTSDELEYVYDEAVDFADERERAHINQYR